MLQLLPRLGFGGAEQGTLDIAAALCRAGHRCSVISAPGARVGELRALGATHIPLDLASKSPRALLRALRLRALLRELAPDLVHLRSRMPAWIYRWAARGLEPAPLVVSTLHGLNSPGCYSAVMTRADAVIAVSQTARDYWLANYPGLDPHRVVLIPRGIDTGRFHPGAAPDPSWWAALHRHHPELAGHRLLCLPGRPSRGKGHTTALQLLARLRAEGRDLALWLPGAAAGRRGFVADLNARANALGIAAHVVIGPPRDDMPQVLAASALLLQLSTKPESFGRTVVEALAVGTPVLGWAQGGVGELLERCYPEGAVPFGDEDGLLERARRLLDTPARQVFIPHEYTLAAMQQATLDLYLRLIATRTP